MKNHSILTLTVFLLCAAVSLNSCKTVGNEATTNNNVETKTNSEKGITTIGTALDPVDYVNNLMGTENKFLLSHGNVYPAIAIPWGMNAWVAQTGEMGDGWQYVYSDNQINGFKQTHMPSPWMNDYGNFAIMPVAAVADTVGGGENMLFGEEERESWFSHKTEISKPYYYSVFLADHDVVAELAPTKRAARFRFTFQSSSESNIVIDAYDDGSFIEIIPEESKVIGYSTKNSGGVPDNFKNYFVIDFDQPFESGTVWSGDELLSGESKAEGNHVGAIIQFATEWGDQIDARVASSFISHEQAEINLEEIGNDSLEKVKADGRAIWNEKLGRILVQGGSQENTETFYSTLYRMLLFPREFHEINAEGETVHYSPHNGKIESGKFYTDTGFWDTFRAHFPFYDLMFQDRNSEIMEGLVNVYEQSGFLPEWASPGHRDIMIGNNSASIIASAYLKGRRGYDIEKLYEGILHGTENVHPEVSSTGRLGHEYYNEIGYIPYDVGINESAARTLEYAYNDWSIYKLAKALDRPVEEIERFRERSLYYQNVFDPDHNLMRGRNEDGSFQSPFNPFRWGDAFTEGNSWHYSWAAMHDMQGLINLMGGEDVFVSMLDSLFILPAVYDDSYYGFPIHEIREKQVVNMGQYAHGNQPIQHMLYLYNYAGQPWKTQYWVRETMDKLYSPTHDGYPGDEDNGQTSAWYVFSAMGFYPVTPAGDQFVLGSPLFPFMEVKLENGNTITIEAENNVSENYYIDEMYVNGESYNKNYIEYSVLMEGPHIRYVMSNEPNKERGTDREAYPYSFSEEN